MYKKKKILCIIPARLNSKGLKKKNLIKIKKKELIVYPIQVAKKSMYIDKVIVTSESNKILNVAGKYKVSLFKRNKNLSLDNVATYNVIKDVLDKIEDIYDYIICLEATSPLTETSDIDNAIKTIINKNADSLVSVSLCEKFHPNFIFNIKSNGYLDSSNKFNKLIRRQDLKKKYFIDGSLYVSKVNKYISNFGFISKKTLPYIVPKLKSFEIDDHTDLKIIKLFLNEKKY
jgi:CMP-N,N'-diacetyllegionaminic acid synthase